MKQRASNCRCRRRAIQFTWIAFLMELGRHPPTSSFLLGSSLNIAFAWTNSPSCHRSSMRIQQHYLYSSTTTPIVLHGAGADIEQPTVDENEATITASVTTAASSVAVNVDSSIPELSRASSDIPLSAAALAARNKVNEIDFCIAPADVSLSRSYGTSAVSVDATTSSKGVELSLTRALNNASNRVVRRILLSRSWPSAEALNLSLRQAALAEKQREEQQQKQQPTGESSAKCPVPRPILNVLTRQRSSNIESKQKDPKLRSRTDEEYVADQIQSFREKYGSVPGFEYAEDYLDSILSLATSGVESNRARKVLEASLYDEAYKRILAVLRTVGVQFITTEDGRQRIAPKLLDQDICLSILDKLQIKHEQEAVLANGHAQTNGNQKSSSVEKAGQKESLAVTENISIINTTDVNNDSAEKAKKNKLMFWGKSKAEGLNTADNKTDGGDVQLTGDDLGGVLLSAKEPTMTRQLNVLSNIVQRALLFGGDQELLVLAETLDADRPAFIDRWYHDTSKSKSSTQSRPGLQYLDCLAMLLRKCYTDGVVTDLSPPLPLSNSYANAYERLVAVAVELGSGYMKPVLNSVDPSSLIIGGTSPTITSSTKKTLPKPRTAQEGIGQFAVWESAARQKMASSVKAASSVYPSDMEGTWEVRDEIGGKTIGSSTVTLLENGDVHVSPPLEGLRWRLDPGPTHLDTLTFQVLSTDGTILQYRGFIDRGARLEARFSKRPIQVRGSVMFQMRDGSATADYYRDVLPINYRQGTTKFVMTKQTSTQSRLRTQS